MTGTSGDIRADGTRRQDWTTGRPVLLLSRCRQCGETWYLPRQRCRVCRGAQVEAVETAGQGTAVARAFGGLISSRVDGSPSGIALVDLDEGVRVMTMCGPQVVPGCRVRITFTPVTSELGPLPLAVPSEASS